MDFIKDKHIFTLTIEAIAILILSIATMIGHLFFDQALAGFAIGLALLIYAVTWITRV